MTFNQAGEVCCQALAMLCKALSQLEVGEICVAAFGKELRILHPLSETWTAQNGATALSEFTFQQTETNIKGMMSSSLDYLDAERGRVMSDVRFGGHHLLQILIIVSDGRIVENRDEVRQFVTRAQKNWQLVVFVIVDNPADPTATFSNSIVDMQVVRFGTNGAMITEPFMQDFPFPFYLVVKDITTLPDILSDSLRQWFEVLSLQL
eukprot:NODE_6570_length_870_cov_39.120482_g5974_i0.p1 GENE.NODE_6570_length_870_cov_39.120482_g5974_i0~~NODE_6570_length_870_cov_39.120482_g5974_i0.p1  ORF type:complete len:225 (-),score=54.09 NODE_6570_length_870_cov_39.120482_g5974_i0:194-814(-)